VIVNRTFAERYLKGRAAAGTVFLWGADGTTPHRIVGVVGNTKAFTIGEDEQPQMYAPLWSSEAGRRQVQFVVRSATPPAAQVAAVRDALRSVEPAAGAEVATMYSSIGLAFLPSQVGAALLGSLGVLGLLLASIGLYGVMVYMVARRTPEIGVRIAIGARSRDISAMVLRDAARLVGLGSAIGLFAAAFVMKPLAMFLAPGLTPSDPATFVAVAAVLAITGVLAGWGPARRAMRVDPMRCLRYE
jgi:predicted lysophospholipase L1 biosynthesis ABC-type transport system permease subunit